jgi:hypothetical protein
MMIEVRLELTAKQLEQLVRVAWLLVLLFYR